MCTILYVCLQCKFTLLIQCKLRIFINISIYFLLSVSSIGLGDYLLNSIAHATSRYDVPIKDSLCYYNSYLGGLQVRLFFGLLFLIYLFQNKWIKFCISSITQTKTKLVIINIAFIVCWRIVESLILLNNNNLISKFGNIVLIKYYPLEFIYFEISGYVYSFSLY